MNPRNSYFEVVEPIFYFRPVGKALSNTWVGSSRVVDTVFAGCTAKPGDVFHCLVGGDFVAGSRELSGCSFQMPKHIFEKSYGPAFSATMLMTELAALGRVIETGAPEERPDYGAARALPDLPANTPRLTYRERSPQYGELLWDANDLLRMVGSDALNVTARDFDERRQVELRIYEGKSLFLSLTMNEDRSLLVKVGKDHFDGASFVDGLRTNSLVRKTHVYHDGFWADDASFLKEGAFLDEVAEALRPLVDGPARPAP